MQVYGIDLSKEKFDVSFIDAKGKEKKQKLIVPAIFGFGVVTCIQVLCGLKLHLP